MVIDNSIELQLHIELAMEGLLMNDSNHLEQEFAVGTLLEQSRTRKKAFSKSMPHLHRVLRCPNSDLHFFEVSINNLGYLDV